METQQTFGLDKPFRNARSALRQFWASHRATSYTQLWRLAIQFVVPAPPPPGRRQWRTTRSAQLSLHAGLVSRPPLDTSPRYRFGRIFFQEDPASPGRLFSTKSCLSTLVLSCPARRECAVNHPFSDSFSLQITPRPNVPKLVPKEG